MSRVTIEYCVPCGLVDRALTTERAILMQHANALEHVALQPGDGGVFEVRVEGDVVYDKDEDEGAEHDVDAIVDRVGAALPDDDASAPDGLADEA